VNENVRKFVAWAAERLQEPTLADSTIELVLGKSSPNRGAYLTVETDELIGRLIFWEDGSAHAEVGLGTEASPNKNWHWEAVEPKNFGREFEPFVRKFFLQTASR
jgi:hypothetical protein